MWLLQLTILAAALSSAIAIDLSIPPVQKEEKKHEKDKKHDTACHDFSKGVTFNDSQAYGSWHLLHYNVDHYGHHKDGDHSTESYCLQFTALPPEERKTISELVGKYVVNLKWENLSLKMQIPCEEVSTNQTRFYYLERLDSDGSYRTLQMPSSTSKLDLASYHRYQMRFKPLEDQYLAMMDCHEKVVFLLGRHTPKGQVDQRLKKIIDVYWPQE